MNAISRRKFLIAAAGAGITYSLFDKVPDLSIFGPEKDPALVVVTLRGGVDPLFILSPKQLADRELVKKMRPTVRVDGGLPLLHHEQLEMNPVLKNMHVMHLKNQLSILWNTGLADNTKSHFLQEQRYESGRKYTSHSDGYLNRLLQILRSTNSNALGLSLNEQLPFSLKGAAPTVNSEDIFSLLNRDSIDSFDRMALSCDEQSDGLQKLCGLAREVPKYIYSQLAIANNFPRSSLASQAAYGEGHIGRSLRQAAQIVRSESAVRVITIDDRGYDTHAIQGNGTQGDLTSKLVQLDQAIGAFTLDTMSKSAERNVFVLVVSEFGRTLRQNGSQGTDHGAGGVTMIFGPEDKLNLKSKALYLADFQAGIDGNDFKTTYLAHNVFAELFRKQFRVSLSDLRSIFPELEYEELSLFKS